VNGLPVDGTTTPRPQTLSVISLVTTGDMPATKFGEAYQSQPWWGDLAELIIFERELTALERKKVEDHLLAKYGVLNTVTTPTISPAGGVFTGSVSVSIETQTPGAEIHYTLDGTEPTLGSPLYEDPLLIEQTVTLKAKAFAGVLTPSATAVAGFTRAEDAVPANVPGLLLWWRADAGVPSGAGDYWEDQSGLGNHGRQTNGAVVAELVPDVASGLPAMRFDGGDTVRFTTSLTTIRSVFWVVSESAAATYANRSLLGDDAYAWRFHGGRGEPGPIWSSSAEPPVRNGQTWVNGLPVDGTTTPRPRTLSVISLLMSTDMSATKFGEAYQSQPWWGDLAELIIFERELRPSEHRAVEDYLNAKYGIFIR
jgi:hypothetical protein